MPAGNFRFKVRPKKDRLTIACGPELTSLLACFATSGDLRHTTTCADSAKALHSCMALRRTDAGQAKSSINHLLGKIRR